MKLSSVLTSIKGVGYYQIERTKDDSFFSVIANISDQTYNQNTQEYVFMDEGLEYGQYQYQITYHSGEESKNSNISEVELTDPNFNVKIYPNPTNSEINLSCENVYNNLDLIIYNQLGTVILKRRYKTFQSEKLILDYPPMIYYITLQNEHFKVTKKFVVFD